MTTWPTEPYAVMYRFDNGRMERRWFAADRGGLESLLERLGLSTDPSTAPGEGRGRIYNNQWCQWTQAPDASDMHAYRNANPYPGSNTVMA
jgi:hypothetical protein